jgi:hypothetical protein
MSANYFVIEAVIQEKISKKESFTAYDITQEVRNRGHRVTHDEVRTEVHSYYDRGLMKDYDRMRESYPSADGSYGSWVHPWCYQPTQHPSVVSKSPQTPAFTQVDAVMTDFAGNDYGGNVIPIPKDLLNE